MGKIGRDIIEKRVPKPRITAERLIRTIRKEAVVKIDNAQRFLHSAKLDLENEIYEGCVWRSHRAVDLALKAGILELKKKMYPWGHDLLELYSHIKDLVSLTTEQIDALRKLNREYEPAEGYSTVSPMKELFSRHDAEEAIDISEVVVNCIQEKIYGKE